jgi:hypothetical protein
MFIEEKEPIKLSEDYKPPNENAPPFMISKKIEDQDMENLIIINEIKNIALGNTQQISTSKIVENIMSKAHCSSRSKFFDFKEESKEPEEDSINDSLNMDFKIFCNEDEIFKPEEISYTNVFESNDFNSTAKCFSTKNNKPTIANAFSSSNSLHVIQEEREADTTDSTTNIQTLVQH